LNERDLAAVRAVVGLAQSWPGMPVTTSFFVF
jgi:hypothetical protein